MISVGIPDIRKPFKIYRDASYQRLSYMYLMQKRKVLAYDSMKLRICKNYPSNDMELASTVFLR